MGLAIRNIRDDEVETFRAAVMMAFGDDLDVDPNGPARTRALIDLAQVWAVFDGTTIAGTAATLDFGVVVPGGAVVQMAGLTNVMVRPTHRRRGLLRQLMQQHLDDARTRKYPLSGLWSSEASIYGRFGYGVAAESDVLEVVDARTVHLVPREVDALDWIDGDRAREMLPAIYARATAQRPGALTRSEVWWRERRFLEAPFMRGGASMRRHVVARRGDELVGYVQFRQRSAWTDGMPSGKVEIIELIAVDARAEASLWQLALQIDLFPHVSWWNAPTDDMLAWAATNPRQVRRRRVDALWLRVEDVAAALTARTYSADGELRFSIDGEPWELVVREGRAARCVRSDGVPELVMQRDALGALYLGGVSASRLARAERITGSAAVLARADRMFASPVAPWCPELF
jgi:predicted acetyltransferase